MALAEHLEKLRHFQRLSNYSSLREGSFAMGISQAGLSKSLAALEDALGTQLFLRTREGLVLTKEGREVLSSSERILSEAASLETRLRSLKASSTPSVLRIGMYDSIAVYFFAELKAYVSTIYPDLEIEMTADTSSSLAKLVQQGSLDIAVGVNLDRSLTNSIEFFKLFEDQYSFYIPSRQDVVGERTPFLIHARADDHDGKTVENYLSAAIKKNGAHRVYNFETLKTLALQGFGTGVLPTQVAKPLVKIGALKTIQIPKLKHLFGTHNIGFLATKSFLRSHREFANDIYRIGDRWSKM